MKIDRMIYGYKYETELTIDELKTAREEYSHYLKYQELIKQLDCYPYFRELTPQQQKKVIQSIDLRATDIATTTNISKEEAVKSIIHSVMYFLVYVLETGEGEKLWNTSKLAK